MSATLGVSGVHLCYYLKASKQLQIGVELEANHRMQEAVASIGYQVDLPKSEVVFKGIGIYKLIIGQSNMDSTSELKLNSCIFA